jgi:uncharacterized membrane protein SpoIIM required for sporulation
MIHGSTELFAVVIAGAAGFHIGRAILFPGALSRAAALQTTGRRAAGAMIGVGIMLFVAALLEGFARQLITDDGARFAFAAIMLSAWLAYFYLPRRDPGDE